MIDGQKNDATKQSPLVSIIVPVYKVEKYLDRCIQSVVEQTYTNIEVILIDDGSPDSCGQICDEYAKRYAFIHVIHQDNQGQAVSRNHAVRESKGEYILFVDSDDYITEDHVEYLVSLINRYEVDIAIGGFYYLYEGKEMPSRSTQNSVSVMNAATAISNMNYGKGYGATPWAKLLPRKVVLNNPFPAGKVYEDLATMYRMFGEVSSIAFGNKIIYYWVQRRNSTTRSEFDERQMYGIKAAEEQIEYLMERYPEAVSSAKARYTAKVIELIGIALNSFNRRKSFKALRHKMKYSGAFLRNSDIRTTLKIRCIAVNMGFFPSVVVYKVHERIKRLIV